MQPGIMITNGGPHPADKWAAQSAAQIAALIQVDEASDSDEARAARRAKPRFELDLADALEDHHDSVQSGERNALDEHGHSRHEHSLDPAEHHEATLEDAMADVAKVAARYPQFADHFARPEVEAVVKSIIASHFATAMHVERSWHRDLGGRSFGR